MTRTITRYTMLFVICFLIEKIINVYLDTEFTDLMNPILRSIGMIADTGEEFYAEVPLP
jgi:hypothetical protein